MSFDTAWLKVNKGFTKELAAWMRKILLDHSDVYFVTHLQVRKKLHFLPDFQAGSELVPKDTFTYLLIFAHFLGVGSTYT